MIEECRFQCWKCKLNWCQNLSDYSADPDPLYPERGKKPCPRCESLYYTWLNFEDLTGGEYGRPSK